MSITIDHDEMEADAPTCLTTTLYDLMAALHAVVAPHEDALVVALVARWLRTGRITSSGKPCRAAACGAARPWRCAGGASPRP